MLEDRERIAKELHDGAIQSLFAVGMGLEGAASLSGDAATAGRIEEAVAEIDRVILDLRNYIFGLRPGILADNRLDEALRQLAEEFAQRSGVVAATRIDENVAFELASCASDVVQMAREALSNIERHANARPASSRCGASTDARSSRSTTTDEGSTPPTLARAVRVCRICARAPRASAAMSPWRARTTRARRCGSGFPSRRRTRMAPWRFRRFA